MVPDDFNSTVIGFYDIFALSDYCMVCSLNMELYLQIFFKCVFFDYTAGSGIREVGAL